MPGEQQPSRSGAARRTAAVLIADVRLGTDAGHVLPPRPLLARVASENCGEIASLSSTELVLAFPRVAQAVEAAALVQAACAQLRDGSSASLRAAVHVGELTLRGGAPEGPAVANGRAIAAAAPRGALYLSSEALAHLELSAKRSRPRPPVLLQSGAPLAVHELAWQKADRLGSPAAPWILAISAGVVFGVVGFLILVAGAKEPPLEPPPWTAAVVASPEPPLPPPPPPQPSPTAPPGDEVPATAKVRKGALTLVTLPESTVRERGKVLGKTPLFSLPLSEGTHLLELVGPDGEVRVLSAPIQKGKTAAFRVVLADLPRR